MSAVLPVEGACMCGRVRVRVSAAPIMTAACHCTGCQKLSASAFSLTVMIPADGFEVIAGQTQIGALHGDTPYHYCPHCLNWLFTSLTTAPFINARPAMFGVPEWSTPFMESCVREKLPWATTPAVHSFDQFPQAHEYGQLMQEFSVRKI